MLLLGTFVVVVGVVASQTVDQTVQAGSQGRDVVNAVIDRIRANCIFKDDRLFLRRLAFVESHDGLDPKTYRNDYHGGIWQVDEYFHNRTASCPYVISNECNIIQQAFNITWSNTKWEDLRKPLYSGLGAALYMLLRLGYTMTMPGDVYQQAYTWSHYYHLNQPDSDYITAAQALRETCQYKLDLAFVIDSSGSIDYLDYYTMLDFIQNVTDSLNYGPDAAQVAAVVFGAEANVSFYFDTYSSKADVLSAIQQIPKDDRGTYTDEAINLAANEVFNERRGARPGVPRFLILLTDGQSQDFALTTLAAEKAKDKGIIILTIGIGAIYQLELETVASDPNCTHMYILDNFSQIESILDQIQRESCKVPVVINPPGNSTNTTGGKIDQNLKPNETSQITYKIDQKWNFVAGKGDILQAEVICGVLDIYVSYFTTNPGPAFYDQKFRATDGHPAIINMVKHYDNRPLYITVIGKSLVTQDNQGLCSNPKYTVSFIKKGAVEVWCKENGAYRQCSKTDFVRAELLHQICGTGSTDNIANPCTKQNIDNGYIVHPHPLDTTKFIKCDMTGQMYITQCPGSEIFNKETHSCGFKSTSVPTGSIPLPPGVANPCTRQAIRDNNYFFPYPLDKHMFIHCDIWGGGWLQGCQSGFIWNDVAKTCVKDFSHEFDKTTTARVQFHNPCIVGSNIMFYPHPDPNKFIHCDVSGNYWVQSCQPGMVFDPSILVCVTDGLHPGT